jgi:hypothetical protein
MRKQDDIDDEATSLQLPETTKVMVGPCAVEIQNIREMRLRRGIDDLGLRDEIRGLAVGSVVRLTLVTGPEPFTGAALLVRITHISGHRFQGELTRKPPGGGMSKLRPGASIAFTTAHIHSLATVQSEVIAKKPAKPKEKKNGRLLSPAAGPAIR